MAAGAIGWKTCGVIETRRIAKDLEYLKSRVLTMHRMAVNMQADWEGILKPDGKNWTFEASCLDSPGSKSFSPLKLHITDVLFDAKKQSCFTFLFFSSGKVWPSGALEFRASNETVGNWDLPAIFGKSEGSGNKKLGPLHPDEA
jgi:hypothetical protein